ncbi:MAG: DUF192 domain-containing protein [Deltaproteobacteria bacterium]|nr:DUF192 domain-containing protein [Deltaproteobacteria bacterium]
MSNALVHPLRQLHHGLALRAVNLTQGTDLVESVELAFNPWRRLRGLMGRDSLKTGEGLLLRPCRSVHTLFMRFDIDLFFLAEDGRVVGLEHHLRPFRFSAHHGGALATLEVSAGQAVHSRSSVGDRVAFIER